MSPDWIDQFMRRDWQTSASSKGAFWAERFRQDGWRAVWDAAQALLSHARRVRPDFPTERDRELDFAHHLALLARLDRASHAFRRR